MPGPEKRVEHLRGGRRDRLLREMDHDPYRSKEKLPEPTLCPECGAVFHGGRWQWGEAPGRADETLCPACRRIQDRAPAGLLTLAGPFFDEHRHEIVNLVRNTEELEKGEHPLHRIMGETDDGETFTVSFTDPHLARRAGEAVHNAYEGELDFHYAEEDVLLRVSWRR